jgi:DNA repair exonuclease SbcCD ATPase subunit
MDDRTDRLREKLAKALREVAELKVALDRAEGKIQGVPHYSVIEDAAHETGCQVSRLVQQIHMTELVAHCSPSGKCPDCGCLQPLNPKKRTILSADGSVELSELAGHCPRCRRAFFPSARDVGV